MKLHLTSFLILLSFVITPTLTTAQEKPWLLSKGAAAREAKRFNLFDWMEQKNRNQVMDMWLSLNSPSPYEFMVSANLYQLTQNKSLQSPVAVTTDSYQNYEIELHAYAQIVGLTAEYKNNTFANESDTTGIFNFRFFGQTLQGSQLTFHYGLRTKTEHNRLYRLNQTFAAGTLQISILKNFGLHSHFRYFYPVTESYYGKTEAQLSQFGIYIDYESLRVMGKVINEKQKSIHTTTNLETLIENVGSEISLQLFF